MLLSRKAPAKLNLGLHVLRKRPDGFHDLETVFVRIDWFDEITVRPSEILGLSCDDPVLRGEDDNLCLLAARKLLQRSEKSRGAAIHLEKRIPMGAGLGGGSSDAATTLNLLNELWSLGLTGAELSKVGSTIGSDVAVFLHETPAFATGRGEILTTLTGKTDDRPLDIPYWFAVLKPDVHVPTSEAYRAVKPNDAGRPDLREVVRSLDLDRWRRELVNDFQKPIAARHPDIKQAIDLLEDSGAGYMAMSGSGSAVFGVFESERAAAEAAERGEAEGLKTWSGAAGEAGE